MSEPRARRPAATQRVLRQRAARARCRHTGQRRRVVHRSARRRRRRATRRRVLGRAGDAGPPPRGRRRLRPGVRRLLRVVVRRRRRGRSRASRSRWPSTPTTTMATRLASNSPDRDTVELRYSIAEVLRHRDFADYSPDELVEARRWMSTLRVTGSPRRSLRLTPTRERTRRPDLRRTVRAAVRTRGDPVERHYRRPATKYRRIVVLLDISGSMEPYARALLRFVQAAVAGRRRVEAFTLGTRLTRVTRELSSHDPDLRPRPRHRGGRRLVRRNPPRRRPRGVQPGVGRARPRPRCRRRGAVRRVGPGRPGRPRRADAAPGAGRPPADLGQPAEGVAGVRTARSGNGRRPAVR